jgi:Domain of unknown function (DUF5664)
MNDWCKAKQQSDEMFCAKCNMRWDVNDPQPPVCAPPQEGRKDDTGKAPYDLIAPEMLDALAAVLDFGARKYEPRNWEKGMRWGRCFAALMRHLWAWWSGRGNDPETGMSHLWHAAACLMFLVAYEARKVGDDDRHRHPLSL